MRVAVYSRVSTDKQDVEAQNFVVNEWLTKRGVSGALRFEDKQSGKDDNRPGLQALREAIAAGVVDTVVVFRLDRLSRRSVTALQLLLDWLNRGINFYAVDQPALHLGVENPLRLTVAAIFSDLAALEREAIVSRVRSGLRAAKARGVKLGTPRKLTPEQVYTARAMRRRGMSCKHVAKQLGVSAATISRLREMP